MQATAISDWITKDTGIRYRLVRLRSTSEQLDDELRRKRSDWNGETVREIADISGAYFDARLECKGKHKSSRKASR